MSSIVCWHCVETINCRHMVAFLCTFEMFDDVVAKLQHILTGLSLRGSYTTSNTLAHEVSQIPTIMTLATVASLFLTWVGKD